MKEGRERSRKPVPPLPATPGVARKNRYSGSTSAIGKTAPGDLCAPEIPESRNFDWISGFNLR